MTLRCLVTCTFLALVLVAQHPASGLAEDHSPTQLLREASRNVARIDDIYEKSAALFGLITAQQKVGDEAGAIMTVELEPLATNRDNAWATVVAIQAGKGNITGATQTLARISEKISRANAMAPIAVAYAASGDIPKALQIAEQIPDNYYAYGDAFFRIAAIQAADGDVPGALHTVADKWHLNPYGLIPIVQAQLSAGSIDQAVELAKVTEDQYLKSYLLLAVATQVKDRKRQLDIAATIPVKGVKALAYKDIAESQLTDGDVQGCLSSLIIATEIVPATSNNFARADLRWRIATIFARAHDIIQARKLAMAIELDGHRDNALRNIIDIQAEGLEYNGALQTASLGTGEDSLIDYALNRIAARQIVVEPVDQAMITIAKIKNDESRRVALASVAETAGEAGRIAEALSLVQMHRLAVAEALKFAETPGALEQVRGLDDRASKLFSDAHFFQFALAGVLNKTALSRAGNGELQEALGYALLIPQLDKRGQTLKSIAFHQTKGGDVDGALRWISAAQLPSQKAFALHGVASALMLNEKK